jgi:ATP-dependent Clp protease ATP-binding subunit ClpA
MGHNYVGTEHILLALLELENAMGVLTGLGIDQTDAETHIATAVNRALAANEEEPP